LPFHKSAPPQSPTTSLGSTEDVSTEDELCTSPFPETFVGQTPFLDGYVCTSDAEDASPPLPMLESALHQPTVAAATPKRAAPHRDARSLIDGAPARRRGDERTQQVPFAPSARTTFALAQQAHIYGTLGNVSGSALARLPFRFPPRSTPPTRPPPPPPEQQQQQRRQHQQAQRVAWARSTARRGWGRASKASIRLPTSGGDATASSSGTPLPSPSSASSASASTSAAAPFSLAARGAPLVLSARSPRRTRMGAPPLFESSPPSSRALWPSGSSSTAPSSAGTSPSPRTPPSPRSPTGQGGDGNAPPKCHSPTADSSPRASMRSPRAATSSTTDSERRPFEVCLSRDSTVARSERRRRRERFRAEVYAINELLRRREEEAFLAFAAARRESQPATSAPASPDGGGGACPSAGGADDALLVNVRLPSSQVPPASNAASQVDRSPPNGATVAQSVIEVKTPPVATIAWDASAADGATSLAVVARADASSATAKDASTAPCSCDSTGSAVAVPSHAGSEVDAGPAAIGVAPMDATERLSVVSLRAAVSAYGFASRGGRRSAPPLLT
jgi:hypothetical protein